MRNMKAVYTTASREERVVPTWNGPSHTKPPRTQSRSKSHIRLYLQVEVVEVFRRLSQTKLNQREGREGERGIACNIANSPQRIGWE